MGSNPPCEILAELLKNFYRVEDQDNAWPYFVAVQPDSPEENITIYDTTDILQGRSVSGGETVVKYGCQLRARGRNYRTTRAELHNIAQWMDEVFNLSLTLDEQTYTVQSIMKSSGIFPLGLTKDKLYEFTLNVVSTIH